MGEWVNVATVEEIPPQGLRVVLGDEEVLLVRMGEEVFALSYLCSHQDMELEGGHIEGPGTWVCPHHGARFDVRTGEALSMPAVESLRSFPVRLEAGAIYLQERT